MGEMCQGWHTERARSEAADADLHMLQSLKAIVGYFSGWLRMQYRKQEKAMSYMVTGCFLSDSPQGDIITSCHHKKTKEPDQ